VNHAKGPCKDIRVRKAISHAIDRKALIVGTQFGLAREASCFYPGDHWAHNPHLRPVCYDPELSRRLLAEAGYEKGLTIGGTAGNDTNSRAISVALKNMLAEVGINWKVDSLDTVAITDRWKNLEFDISLTGWPYIQDPDVLSWQYLPDGAWNFGRVKNEKVIPLLKAAQGEIDQNKRQKIYHDIEAIIYNDYGDIWLWWEVTPVAYRKVVQGWNNEMFIENRTLYTYSHPLWFKEGHP
jgi:ABC-type transport system substrate-binding protein